MYNVQQVVAIYMHATTDNYKLRELTIIVSQATPSLQRVWLARRILTLKVFTFLCTTVSHYYRETCFKVATCADFRISDSGDYHVITKTVVR